MVSLIAYHDGCVKQDVPHCWHVLQHHRDSQRSDDLQSGVEIAVFWQCDEVLEVPICQQQVPISVNNPQTYAVVASRICHQPYSHFDNNSQRRLRKDAVIVRPEAVVEEGIRLVGLLLMRRGAWIRLRVWDASHAASPESPVGENDVHAAVHHPVIAVGRVA
jgi:hypothetical protein